MICRRLVNVMVKPRMPFGSYLETVRVAIIYILHPTIAPVRFVFVLKETVLELVFSNCMLSVSTIRGAPEEM